MNNIDINKRKKYAYLEGWLSIVINTILFVLKYWVGFVTGSIAIIADAWHTLSDSLSSIVVLIGAKMSTKSPDKEHPFGHGRAELIASIVIGILLGVVGFNFIDNSIERLKNHTAASYSILAVIIFIVSVLMKEGIAQFSIRIGKKLSYLSLIADGWHHRSDAIASVVILCGIFLGSYFWWIDGVMGIVVAILILYTAFDILRQSVNPLIGESPNNEFLDELYTLTSKNIPFKFNIHHVKIHRYGSHTECTMHLKYLQEISFSEAHMQISNLEKVLINNMNIAPTIHYEPVK
jgi:cation diffusion facilitator family transporter